MKTIHQETEYEFIIKNSRFIANVFPLEENDITPYMEKVKEKYPHATHYCYAYRYLDYSKCSDDKEPSNTAGYPILNVLEKEDLTNLVVIVVRYFGGIKLGTGGLVRAYTKSVKEALKTIPFLPLEEGYIVRISFPYSSSKEIDYLLKDQRILNKEFLEDIVYTALIPTSFLSSLEKYSYEIIQKTFYPKQ